MSNNVLILIIVPSLINAPCLFSANNVILTCVNFCLFQLMMQLIDTESTLKEKNLLLKERGWSSGAMVLGKLPVPGRTTIWIIVGQGPIALTVGVGGGCLEILLSIFSLQFLPFSGRRPDID